MDISMKSCERVRLAKSQGLPEANDVRCYHCKRWDYNYGKLMDTVSAQSMNTKRQTIDGASTSTMQAIISNKKTCAKSLTRSLKCGILNTTKR